MFIDLYYDYTLIISDLKEVKIHANIRKSINNEDNYFENNYS